MSSKTEDSLIVALFSEITFSDQLLRAQLTKALPSGMELSHFTLLNFLVHTETPKTPGQLSRAFHISKGAITNTLNKLEISGYIHVHPDWDDARSKRITISPAGRRARDHAIQAMTPFLDEMLTEIGKENAKLALPVLRKLRQSLS